LDNFIPKFRKLSRNIKKGAATLTGDSLENAGQIYENICQNGCSMIFIKKKPRRVSGEAGIWVLGLKLMSW